MGTTLSSTRGDITMSLAISEYVGFVINVGDDRQITFAIDRDDFFHAVSVEGGIAILGRTDGERVAYRPPVEPGDEKVRVSAVRKALGAINDEGQFDPDEVMRLDDILAVAVAIEKARK